MPKATQADNDQLLTVSDVARRLRKSEKWVRGALQRKEIIGGIVGGTYRVEPCEIDAYLQRARVAGPIASKRRTPKADS